MYRKKVWIPVTTILRKILPSSSRFYQIQSSRPNLQRINCPTVTSYISLHNPNVFPKSCSFGTDSAGKSGVTRCWNCSVTPGEAPFLFCESCRSVQPVDHSVDYFQIFGWEKMYVFDDKNLEGMYKDWQKKLHPDLVHSKSEQEKEYAAEQSARIIDAYHTLKKPLSRAIYVLNLEGVVVDEEQKISDLDLLAEIVEKLKHSSESFANAFQRRILKKLEVPFRE